MPITRSQVKSDRAAAVYMGLAAVVNHGLEHGSVRDTQKLLAMLSASSKQLGRAFAEQSRFAEELVCKSAVSASLLHTHAHPRYVMDSAMNAAASAGDTGVYLSLRKLYRKTEGCDVGYTQVYSHVARSASNGHSFIARSELSQRAAGRFTKQQRASLAYAAGTARAAKASPATSRRSSKTRSSHRRRRRSRRSTDA